MGTVLITSLPPRMSRPLADGRDIGAEYQVLCVASWRAAGFSEIISVNSRRELEAVPQIHEVAEKCGVRVVAVERDAADLVGKPYAYIADMVAAGAEIAGDGNLAIVNADIMLAPGAADLVAATVRPGQFAIARRFALDRPDGPLGDPYYWGFDFFAGAARDFAAVPDIGLIVGCHWWDHFFPAMLCCAGNRLVHIEEPMVLHLEHEERSGDEIRYKLGHRFIPKIKSLISSRRWKTEAGALFAQGFDRALYKKSGRPLRDFAAATRRRLPPYLERERQEVLHRLVYHSLEYLDRYKASGKQQAM